MKKFAAIVFSLLLVVAQAIMAGSAANSAGGGCVSITTPTCCCDGCSCAISSSDAPSAPVTPVAVPLMAQQQFVLPPTAVLFTLAAPTDQICPNFFSVGFHPAQPPIFRRNCSLLI